MSKKVVGMRVDELPPKVAEMLGHFQANFNNPDYTVTHYRDDAVFVRVYGMCNLYSVVRFIQNVSDVYVELEATSRKYWTLRMFCSDWMQEHEMPSRLSYARSRPSESYREVTHVKVQMDSVERRRR